MIPPESRADWIIRHARGRSPAELAAFLDDACGGDEALRKRVETLMQFEARLQANAQRDTGLELTLPDADSLRERLEAQIRVLSEAEALEPSGEAPGTLVGHYQLLEKIGEGGFGDVYAAEQKEPFKRRVALKIIKLGMDTRQVVARFEAERQALALMNQPNIAKVFDAGAMNTGRPFFVMELVRGIKITDKR